MSLWQELRQRNVFRATLAYGVFAWLLLQVVEFVLEVVGSPDWVLRVLVVLAVAGLPAVAVFSWAFELTPEGIKREADVDRNTSIRPETGRRLNRITMVSLVVLVAFLLADRISEPDGEAPPAPVPEANQASVATPPTTSGADIPSADAGATQTSVAVLPFTNMSPDPDNEYFADGISEELLNVLAGIEQLRVPSRTSSFSFKGVNTNIREIASVLEVDHILEGSVRKSGNQVRITAQLIDVSTDTHLWSETYDHQLEDIFAVQDEIAGQIVDALKLALAIDDTVPPTDDLEAYTLYLRGRELFRLRDPEGLLQAEQLLSEATDRDPGFADAWAIRALIQSVLPGYVKDEYVKFLDATRAFAERALAIDPDHPEAMLALAQTLNVTGENAAAVDQFAALVKQHPQHSTARLWYAISLMEFGYVQEAYEQVSAALDVDPVHGTILDWYGRIAHAAGHPARVIETGARAIELGRPQGRVAIHNAFIVDGNMEDMAPYVAGESPHTWGWMLRVYEVRDDPSGFEASMAWADEAERSGAGFMAEYMRINFLMVGGTPDAYFEQVRAIAPVDDTVNAFVWMKASARHRQGPAMKDWVREMGYDDLWRERGWPDLCRPLGDDDFECD